MGGQDHRTYTDAENAQLTRRLIELTTRIHEGELSTRDLSTELLRYLHRELFQDIRFHAGQCRTSTWGSEHLEFGPNRSSFRAAVASELESVFAQVRKSVISCDENPDDPNYERGAFYIAVWLHARVIQIHPFEDGNGRTSRLIMNVLLVRLGLPPVALEVPKQEYNAALNEFFRGEPLDAAIDLILPCCVRMA